MSGKKIPDKLPEPSLRRRVRSKNTEGMAKSNHPGWVLARAASNAVSKAL
jgi:hypothetical protein